MEKLQNKESLNEDFKNELSGLQNEILRNNEEKLNSMKESKNVVDGVYTKLGDLVALENQLREPSEYRDSLQADYQLLKGYLDEMKEIIDIYSKGFPTGQKFNRKTVNDNVEKFEKYANKAKEIESKLKNMEKEIKGLLRDQDLKDQIDSLKKENERLKEENQPNSTETQEDKTKKTNEIKKKGGKKTDKTGKKNRKPATNPNTIDIPDRVKKIKDKEKESKDKEKESNIDKLEKKYFELKNRVTVLNINIDSFNKDKRLQTKENRVKLSINKNNINREIIRLTNEVDKLDADRDYDLMVRINAAPSSTLSYWIKTELEIKTIKEIK